MFKIPNILDKACADFKQDIKLNLLLEKSQTTPETVQYKVERYERPHQYEVDDMGMLIYHKNLKDNSQSFLEIQYCLSGNIFCIEKKTECDFCNSNPTEFCTDKRDSIDIIKFRFTPSQLAQLVKPRDSESDNSLKILTFQLSESFTKVLPICSKSRSILDAMLSHKFADTYENIYFNAQSQILLLYSLDCMVGDEKIGEKFKCKFLNNQDDRAKIVSAREILINNIGEQLTIKKLSRKVAINECYLKKGFKEMYGTTIFEFYQNQRMEHAKYLLYEKGLSVTQVSSILGYSSISHFSSAFKKHTGIKPCELLNKEVELERA